LDFQIRQAHPVLSIGIQFSEPPPGMSAYDIYGVISIVTKDQSQNPTPRPNPQWPWLQTPCSNLSGSRQTPSYSPLHTTVQLIFHWVQQLCCQGLPGKCLIVWKDEVRVRCLLQLYVLLHSFSPLSLIPLCQARAGYLAYNIHPVKKIPEVSI
jgi:hypothetical protein